MAVQGLRGGVEKGGRCELWSAPDHRRPQRQDVLFEAAKTIRQGAEPGPRLAEDRVAAPAEIAKLDTAVRIADGQQRLPVAITLFALDEGIAQENNAVAVYQLKVAGGGGGWCSEYAEAKGAQK
jgi:hypothetical protein